MPYFWASSRDLDVDVRIEADNLEHASDQVGRMIDGEVVTGLVNQVLERVVIINWCSLRQVIVASEAPASSSKAFVGLEDSTVQLDWVQLAREHSEGFDPES